MVVAISVWELLMLVQKAQLQLNEGPVAWAVRAIEQLQLHEATLTTEVAIETSVLDLPNSDPSDRLIAASAKVFDLTLVTADVKLISVPGIRVLANRGVRSGNYRPEDVRCFEAVGTSIPVSGRTPIFRDRNAPSTS